MRLIGLLAVRNQVHHLAGYMRNVAPQVDGIVALDDGSDDGSAEFLAAQPAVLELLRVPPDRPAWDEVGNHRALVRAALRHDAEWLLSVDADERIEATFRARAERAIRRGRPIGVNAFAVQLRELWDDPRTFRVDGVWGRKARARLFRARPDHEFDTRDLHGIKASLRDRHLGDYPIVDINIYHLAMLDAASRAARRRRYEELDPESRWQPDIGYAYLTDERGLQLQRILPAREYDR